MRRIGNRMPQRRIPRLVRVGRRRLGPRRPGHPAVRRQLHLIRNLAGHHEAQPLTRLRRDEHRIGELDLLLLEFGDLGAQLRLGGLQLLHLGALRKVRPHRASDGQGQHAHHGGQDGGSARGRAEALIGLLFCRSRNGLTDRLGGLCQARIPEQAATRLPAAHAEHPADGPYPRRRPCPAGKPGTAASDRAVSLRARAIWPPPRSAGMPDHLRSARRHQAFPRCAAAGCTWRPARCGPVHRS